MAFVNIPISPRDFRFTITHVTKDWELSFDSIDAMVTMLHDYMTTRCCHCIDSLSQDFPFMLVEEQLNELLGTECGCEFDVCQRTSIELEEVVGDD